jgi:hypothetical protein
VLSLLAGGATTAMEWACVMPKAVKISVCSQLINILNSRYNSELIINVNLPEYFIFSAAITFWLRLTPNKVTPVQECDANEA